MRVSFANSPARATRSCCPIRQQNVKQPHRMTCRAAPATQVETELIGLLQQLEAQHNSLTEEDVLAQVSIIEDISARNGLNKIVPENIVGYFKASALNGYLKMATSDDSKLTLGALSLQAIQPADRKVSYNKAARTRSLWRGKRGGVDSYIIPSSIAVDGTDLIAVSEAVMEYTLPLEEPSVFNITYKDVVVTPEFQEGKEKEQLQQWLDLMGEPNKDNSIDPATGVITAKIQIPISTSVEVLVNLPSWHLIRASKTGSCSLFRRVSGKYADE